MCLVRSGGRHGACIDLGVVQRVARLLLGLGAVACGAPSSIEPERSAIAAKALFGADTNEAEIARDASPNTADIGEAVCPGREAELPGSPLWLQAFDTAEITSLASDSEGNLVFARSGIELTKLDCAGGLQWSKPFGTHVAIDSHDAVYVAGTFTDTLAVDDRTTLRAYGSAAFMIKLDGAGQVVHARALGQAAEGAIKSLAVDGEGRVAVSGEGFGTVKLDESGNPLWSKPLSGKVRFDGAGNLLLTGAFTGTLNLGTSTLTSQGGSDILLLKLDRHGTPVFAHGYGDVGAQQRADAIAVDAEGNVIVAGTFDGRVDFGAGALELTPGQCSTDAWCVTDGFAAKFNPRGEAIWSVGFGPMRAVSDLALDSSGNGVLSGTLPGGVRPFRQTWLAKLDPNGTEIWHRSEWPETGIGAGQAVAVDADDRVLWSLSSRPSLELPEQAYLAKLTP